MSLSSSSVRVPVRRLGHGPGRHRFKCDSSDMAERKISRSSLSPPGVDGQVIEKIAKIAYIEWRRRSGGTGRRAGLKIQSLATGVWVRFPPPARLISLCFQRFWKIQVSLLSFNPDALTSTLFNRFCHIFGTREDFCLRHTGLLG